MFTNLLFGNPGAPQGYSSAKLKAILWFNGKVGQWWAISMMAHLYFLPFCSIPEVGDTTGEPVNWGDLFNILREKYFIASKSKWECHFQDLMPV